jgi:hypothetical protein
MAALLDDDLATVDDVGPVVTTTVCPPTVTTAAGDDDDEVDEVEEADGEAAAFTVPTPVRYTEKKFTPPPADRLEGSPYNQGGSEPTRFRWVSYAGCVALGDVD